MTSPTLRVIALTALGGCALLLAGCSKKTVDETANINKAPKIAVCTSAGLTASLNGITGTAGTYYTTLTVTNTGTSSCVLKGKAKLALLNANAEELGNVSSPDTNMTLTPGEPIYASVAFPDASNYADTNACKSGGVIVNFYAPGQSAPIQAYDTRTVKANWAVHACPGFALNAFSTVKP